MALLEDLKSRVNDFLDGLAIKKLENQVRLILKARKELKDWSDRDLRLAALAFKDDLQNGRYLDGLAVEAFAVVNEAAVRVFKKLPFDVQILAGLVIHSGRVAEMKAGEGKTLTETMPVYLNALAGKGVHIITTNDYLAERDAKEMGKLYDFLGISAGFVTSAMKNAERKKAYAADITYVSNQEIGFDYLRDNLVFARKERVLRPKHALHFGIVDEIDSILIDESRTPLIIAESVKEEVNFYNIFTKIVNKLVEDKDYEVNYQAKQAAMTEDGFNKVEALLGQPLFSKDNPMYVFYLDACLKARVIFEKNRDYVVDKNQVEIVDEFTGRVLPGRRFTDGLHQAIEAKEKVKIKESDKTQAAITFQNFFPLYQKLSGMSGTVMRARDELNKVYKLDVVQIPTNRPIVRNDHNDFFFKTQKGKLGGLLNLVKQIHGKNQPLLIGARNVEAAHQASELLGDANFPCQLLTASDHEAEAAKVAKAGQPGMITVATNIAGRGTDILLGIGVAELGGLYVIGTERHESRRIDDQLVGRSGRQGEPGESVFLISMEDEIMSRFGSERIIDVMELLDIPEDEYISGQHLSQAFAKAQDFVESKNLDGRLYLYKYDSVTNYQRKFIYDLRESLLENEANFLEFLKKAVGEVAREIFELKDAQLITKDMDSVFHISLPLPPEGLLSSRSKPESFFNEWLNPFYEPLTERAALKLQQKLVLELENLALTISSQPKVYQAGQNLILEIIDNQWGSHLELVDILKEEASLFSYASKDPLIDYILESRKLFEIMQHEIKRQFLSSIFLYLKQTNSLPPKLVFPS